MPTFVPVDIDPFATATPQQDAAPGARAPTFTPVDHDPFANGEANPAAPAGVRNVATAKSDPIYHGAVPITQAPDQGAATAFTSGVGGVPIIGPAIEGGLQRIAAGARSMMGGGSYGAELEHAREMTDIARQQHPIAAGAGDITGAGLALAPVMAAAPAAFGAGAGELTAGKIAAGAASGSLIGAADGGVRGGSATSAATGALGGAVGGALGPAIGAGIGRVATSAADAAARAVALRGVGVSRPAAEIITRAAEADGALGGRGAANIANAGPQGMLADAGPGVANVLDTTMQRGGPGTVAARDAIEARAAGADANLTSVLDRSFGAPQGVQTATADIRNASAPARQTAYDAAYGTPIDYTTEQGRALEAMVANRVPPGIVARANAMMRTEGAPSRQMIQRPDGTLETMPDVRQIDYITRSLNDVARAGDGQGALGGNTAEGRAYGGLARELRDTLRGAVPEYGTALDTAAQPIQARNAVEFGSQLLSPSVPRDVAAETIRGMTAPELAAARQGVRSQMAEAIANVKRTITDPNIDARQAMAAVKDLSSDAAQEKVGLLLDPGQHAYLRSELTQAARALELRANVATNSKTAARLMTKETIDQATAPGVFDRLLAGEPVKGGQAALQFLTARRPGDMAGRQDRIYGELADVLTGPRGQAATDLLTRLQQANNTRAGVNSIAGNIPYGAMSSTGILALLAGADAKANP